MTDVRDFQQAKVYAAENSVADALATAARHDVPTIDFHGSLLTLPLERKFGNIEGVQAYVDAVLALNWVREAYPAADSPIRVRSRKGDAEAHYQYGVIAVPPHRGSRHSWAMRELVVLHEIAHHLARGAAHGPEFVSTLTELVRGVVGPEVGLLLLAAFHEGGVESRVAACC